MKGYFAYHYAHHYGFEKDFVKILKEKTKKQLQQKSALQTVKVSEHKSNKPTQTKKQNTKV
jgi:hypothetical protein